MSMRSSVSTVALHRLQTPSKKRTPCACTGGAEIGAVAKLFTQAFYCAPTPARSNSLIRRAKPKPQPPDWLCALATLAGQVME